MKVYVPSTIGTKKIEEYEVTGPHFCFNGKLEYFDTSLGRQFYAYAEGTLWFKNYDDAMKVAEDSIKTQIKKHKFELDRLETLLNGDA